MAEDCTPTDIEALHGQTVEVEDVDLIEDADGIPSWIKVEREMATVVIVPSLLGPIRQTAEPHVSARSLPTTEQESPAPEPHRS